MALLTDDQDIREVYLHTEYGGNGDYYLSISEGDKRLNFRVATSGGNAPTNVKLAIASLFRIMEDAGLNDQPNPPVTLNQTGEQCFTKEMIADDLSSHITDKELQYFNEKTAAYAARQNRELLAWKESAMKVMNEIDLQAIGKEIGVPLGHSVSENLLEKIKAYRLYGMKKALEKAAENAKVSYDPRLSSPYFVNKTSITNSENLVV